MTSGAGGEVSIVTLNPTTVTTITTGFSAPGGILYDGTNIWVADAAAGTLLKLNSDGSNIWVPNKNSNSVGVVRVKDAQGNSLASAFLLATLTGNGLNNPVGVAFDGERMLVTNNTGNSVSLWKAADLTALGTLAVGGLPFGVCSDGLNFWFTLGNPNKVARF